MTTLMRKKDPLQVIGWRKHVAVKEYDPIIFRAAPAFGHIVELRVIGQMLSSADELSCYLGVLCDQATHDGHDRVAGVIDAEYDLVNWPIELERGSKGLEGEWFNAANRSYDRYRRAPFAIGLLARHTASRQRYRDREELKQEIQGRDCSREKIRNHHDNQTRRSLLHDRDGFHVNGRHKIETKIMHPVCISEGGRKHG